MDSNASEDNTHQPEIYNDCDSALNLAAPKPTLPNDSRAYFFNKPQTPGPPTLGPATQPPVRSPSDLVLRTTDSALFYVLARILHQASRDAFSSILDISITSPQLHNMVVNVPDTSDVLDVILHCLYGTSFTHSPTFDTIAMAIDRMPFYSFTPSKHILPGSPSYNFILAYEALYPLRIYALAAHHHLEDVVVASSFHLLSISISDISDDIAIKMGSIYLNRLMQLHLRRLEMLKSILRCPLPLPQHGSNTCTLEDQKELSRSWTIVAVQIAWDARPNLSSDSIRAAFSTLVDALACNTCIEGLRDRIKNVVHEWDNVKHTI